MSYDFDWAMLVRAWPYLFEGLKMTALLVIVAMIAGIALGTGLAIVRIYSKGFIAAIAAAYVNVFRSIPLILTILWFYFLMPPVIRFITQDANFSVGPIYAALAAFVLAESAYYCEIIRAGIASVAPAQMQAAQSLGMTRWQALRAIVLPQAFRNMTPSLINQTIALLKDTSLVYVISLNDFLGAATKIGQRDGRVVEVYLFVALVYFVLCTTGALLVTRLQRSRLSSV